MPAAPPVLVHSNEQPTWTRPLVLAAALAVFYVALRGVTPWVAGLVGSWRGLDDPEHRRFLGHLLTFSLPYALCAAAAWAIFVRLGFFAAPRFRDRAGRAALEGTSGAALLVIGAVATWWALGLPFGWNPSLLDFAGNLFSNAYEEIAYRGLILSAALYAFRRRWLAVLLSAAVFAGTHASYPPHLIALVGLAGVIFGAVYVRTGNLLAPWLAHQLSDMVLDTILAT